MRSQIPISVNLLVARKCNYKCRFCFSHLHGLEEEFSTDQLLEIPPLLKSAGCEKLTLTGGEPFLCPMLDDVLRVAKESGLTTCVVTNGSLLTRHRLHSLKDSMDWIGLSLDSASEEVEVKLGRGLGNHVSQIRRVGSWAHELGMKLKMNSVVTSLTYDEDMTGMIKELSPARWKAFQVLPIDGENHTEVEELIISGREFRTFVSRNSCIREPGIEFVPETSDDMEDSYISILPDGRFFSNRGRKYSYGENTIFEVGVHEALGQVSWDEKKFIRRGGIYDW